MNAALPRNSQRGFTYATADWHVAGAVAGADLIATTAAAMGSSIISSFNSFVRGVVVVGVLTRVRYYVNDVPVGEVRSEKTLVPGICSPRYTCHRLLFSSRRGETVSG